MAQLCKSVGVAHGLLCLSFKFFDKYSGSVTHPHTSSQIAHGRVLVRGVVLAPFRNGTIHDFENA